MCNRDVGGWCDQGGARCVTGVEEDGVIWVELGCAKGMQEDDVIRVELGCVTGVGEDGVIALPSPREYDAITAADVGTLAAFCFSAAVFHILGGASGFGYTTTAFQMRVFVFMVTCSPIFRGPLMFFSLLSLEADSKYSL